MEYEVEYDEKTGYWCIFYKDKAIASYIDKKEAINKATELNCSKVLK